MGLSIFLSYARTDTRAVASLISTLEQLGHRVWFDERIVGGQNWWTTILAEIRRSDVMIVARSPGYARSGICRTEREYAEALSRRIVPVRVASSAEEFDGLGIVDTIDWRNPGERRVTELAVALPSDATAPPLPDPLPAEPPSPVVDLSRPHEIVTGRVIDRLAQGEFLEQLGSYVDDPDCSEAVVDLLKQFVGRSGDVIADNRERAEELLASAKKSLRSRRGRSAPADLRTMFREGGRRTKLLPIIGSGLNETLTGPRSDVAEQLRLDYEAVRTGRLSDDLPGVAQFLLGFHGEQDMRDLVMEAFRDTMQDLVDEDLATAAVELDELLVAHWERERHDEEPHLVLARLPCPIFVNASPSRLFCEALRAVGKEPQVELCRWRTDLEDWPESLFGQGTSQTDYQTTVERPLVFQIFGSFEHPETLVLSEDDFLRFLHQVGRREAATAGDAIPMCVKAAATTSRLLMLGFGLEDLDARVLMMSLIDQEGNRKRKPSGLAVQVDPDGPVESTNQARKYLERYFSNERRIQLYWGSTEDFAADLVMFLEEQR